MLPAHALALLLALGSGTTVLRSVTWIDVQGADAAAARHPGTSVVWRGDEILALGPDAEIAVPDGALVLDGSGRFLIPGLIDMHVHLAGTGSPPPDAMRALLREAGLAGLRVAAHEPSSIDLVEAAELGLGSLEHLPIHALLDETTPERWRTGVVLGPERRAALLGR